MRGLGNHKALARATLNSVSLNPNIHTPIKTILSVPLKNYINPRRSPIDYVDASSKTTVRGAFSSFPTEKIKLWKAKAVLNNPYLNLQNPHYNL